MLYPTTRIVPSSTIYRLTVLALFGYPITIREPKDAVRVGWSVKNEVSVT